jgi:F-box protein 9
MPDSPLPEPDELVRFREAWKAEVQQKKARQDPSQRTNDSDDKVIPGPSSEQIAGSPTPHSVGPPALRTAIELYRRAVDDEQGGRLDDALRLYRSAFRMDPNVDKAFHREEKLVAISPVVIRGTVAVEELPQKSTTAVSVTPAGIATGTLASLLSTFPSDLVFERENEREPIPLNNVPDEVLVLILRKLDHSTLERFASASRKARILSLDAIIWKYVHLYPAS